MTPRPRSIVRFSSTSTLVSNYRIRLPTLRKLYIDQKIRSYLDGIALTDHDITKLPVDAIVNPARPDLLPDSKGSVNHEIHEAAGPMLLEECKRLDGCNVGDAQITDACKLHFKCVIHTVGPIYKTSHATEKMDLLAACYRRSLRLAAAHKLRKIAFPLISVGQKEFLLDDEIRIALGTVRRFFSAPESEEVRTLGIHRVFRASIKATLFRLKIELVVFVAHGDDQMTAFKKVSDLLSEANT
ncbi:hypothetical protein A7U60_g807 [Sanghuangporus baumii]|uniref:Macro domain-containing protein n=1 Tax=Sanghuangporus baumii TaxID=108892 RepID=A0A9Q5I5J5_SANBA|nr:hypothetical protein A7U60_g807 [Sanghuangporus baumii]